MSRIDDFKASRSRYSSTLAAHDGKRPGSSVWDYVENPDMEHNGMLVPISRPVEYFHPLAEDNGYQSQMGQTQQRSPQERPGERKHERSTFSGNRTGREKLSIPPQAHLDAIYNSTHTKDVTVHLEFDVVSDLEDELEEFNRLVRRGNFANAKAYFDNHLMAHITNPWVFVQYAEMLLEMGDFKSFHQLDPEPVLFSVEPDASETSKAVHLNWTLLKALALFYSQFELQPILDEVCQVQEILPLAENIGSTEIRNVCLVMRVLRSIYHAYAYQRLPFSVYLEDWGNWEKIYQNLQSQGRVWDFRDLFTSAYQLFGPKIVEEEFFGSREITEVLLTDWSNVEQDDSTLLALLDILVCLAHGDPMLATQYLPSASAIGEIIMDKFPYDVKTRPFLQWILVQSSLSARSDSPNHMGFDYLIKFTGQAMFPAHIGLPSYIPVRQENPGWVPSDMPPESIQQLEMILSAARELKDYDTESLCYMEIAVRSSKPSRAFSELAGLQKEVQQNMLGFLATCISRYLVAEDADSKARLLRDLNDLGPWEDPSNLTIPIEACTRDILQKALSSPQHSSQQNSVKAGVRYYDWLPGFFQDLIDRHVDHPRSSLPTTNQHYESQPQSHFIRPRLPPESHVYSNFQHPSYPRAHARASRKRSPSLNQKHPPNEASSSAKGKKVTEKPSQKWDGPRSSRSYQPLVEDTDDSSEGTIKKAGEGEKEMDIIPEEVE